jgi:hypothetical protein
MDAEVPFTHLIAPTSSIKNFLKASIARDKAKI